MRQEDGIDCSVLRLPFGTAGGLIFEKCSDPIINPSKEQYMSRNATLLFFLFFPSPKDLLRALTLNKNRNVSLQISLGFASFNIKV